MKSRADLFLERLSDNSFILVPKEHKKRRRRRIIGTVDISVFKSIEL